MWTTLSSRTSCQYRGSRIMPPNSAAPRQNIANDADENVALRYRRMSSNGLGTRSAWSTNAATSAGPRMHGMMTLSEVKPPVTPISARP